MAQPKGWKFCPKCAEQLTSKTIDGQDVTSCSSSSCDFIDWNNPIPVVAALIPHGDGIVLVKRGAAPFIGRWCLPRGFLQTDENPKGATVRETFEETGLIINLKRMLNACNPSPPGYALNQITLFYLATTVGGQLEAGDDAQEVGVFGPDNLPDLCFRSDIQLIADWYKGVHGTVDAPVNYRTPDLSELQQLLK